MSIELCARSMIEPGLEITPLGIHTYVRLECLKATSYLDKTRKLLSICTLDDFCRSVLIAAADRETCSLFLDRTGADGQTAKGLGLIVLRTPSIRPFYCLAAPAFPHRSILRPIRPVALTPVCQSSRLILKGRKEGRSSVASEA